MVIPEKKELLPLKPLVHMAYVVLQLSKLTMYELFYDFSKKKFKNIELLYMDTGSFIIENTDENNDEYV